MVCFKGACEFTGKGGDLLGGLARVQGGAMVGSGFDGIEERIAPLVEIGLSTLADRTV